MSELKNNRVPLTPEQFAHLRALSQGRRDLLYPEIRRVVDALFPLNPDE